MIDVMEVANVFGVEARVTALPVEFQHALKFAEAHDLVVILGYVADEAKVYLATIPEILEDSPT